MKKIVFTYIYIFVMPLMLFAQQRDQSFTQFYPIGESPSVRSMSPYKKQEGILFYAQPIVRYGLYNNIKSGLMDESRRYSHAWYILFMPQIRMFTFDSNPVVMPSYRAFLGTQHIFKLPTSSASKRYLLGVAAESGEYFNGQIGCSFRDGNGVLTTTSKGCAQAISPQANLSELLNRQDGRLVVASSRLMLNFRVYDIDADRLPVQLHSFQIGYTRWHDKVFGLFAAESQQSKVPNPKNWLGVNRFQANYEYQRKLRGGVRISVKENTEYIQGAHRSINPFRSETMAILYPLKKTRAIGFFGAYIYGHDDYNLRMVDAGSVYSFGIRWSEFPPLKL